MRLWTHTCPHTVVSRHTLALPYQLLMSVDLNLKKLMDLFLRYATLTFHDCQRKPCAVFMQIATRALGSVMDWENSHEKFTFWRLTPFSLRLLDDPVLSCQLHCVHHCFLHCRRYMSASAVIQSGGGICVAEVLILKLSDLSLAVQVWLRQTNA